MKKRPEQTSRTRQQIVDAFWGLYEERPIEHIAVKEVVAKAGCHRSTFYEYFSNVYEILEYIEDELLEELRKGFEEGLEEPDSEEIITYQIEQFQNQGRYVSVLVSEDGDPLFAEKIQDNFAEKIKPRITSELSDEHIEYLNQFTAGGFAAVMTKWVREGGTFPSEDLIKITHVFKELEIKILKGEVAFDR